MTAGQPSPNAARLRALGQHPGPIHNPSLSQGRGTSKLQCCEFLHALSMVADKGRTGFKDVCDRVKRYGINVRQPSMTDFLVMRDAGATTRTRAT